MKLLKNNANDALLDEIRALRKEVAELGEKISALEEKKATTPEE